MLADAAEVRENLAFVLAGGIDTINAGNLPTVLNAAILVRVLLDESEADKSHDVEIRINDEDGKQLALVRGQFTTSAGDTPAGWDIPAMFTLTFAGLQLDRAGRYSVEVVEDSQHLKSLNFRVKLVDVRTPVSDVSQS
jgi:hypothetical protein